MPNGFYKLFTVLNGRVDTPKKIMIVELMLYFILPQYLSWKRCRLLALIRLLEFDSLLPLLGYSESSPNSPLEAIGSQLPIATAKKKQKKNKPYD
jgi:hypothetical protein